MELAIVYAEVAATTSHYQQQESPKHTADTQKPPKLTADMLYDKVEFGASFVQIESDDSEDMEWGDQELWHNDIQ